MRDGPGDGLSAEPRVADVADAQRRERPEGARLEHDMALPELRELHCALSAADRHSAYDGLPARRVVAGGMRRRKGETGRGLPPGVPRLGEIHRTAVRGGTDRGIQGPDDAARTRPAPGAGHAGERQAEPAARAGEKQKGDPAYFRRGR